MKNISISAWIIDDEERSAKTLKNMLAKVAPAVEVIETYFDPSEADTSIGLPDVIFLDIHMPEVNGITFAQHLWKQTEIVFTTAHADDALQAHEVHPFDYLLKPFSEERLSKVIEELEEKIEKKKESTGTGEHPLADRIMIPTLDAIHFLHISEIVHVEARNNCSAFFMEASKTIVTAKTLRTVEDFLSPINHFFRAHKSHLVNLKYVIRFDNKEDALILKHYEKVFIPVSRDRKRELLELLKARLL
jgi:two-component system LytT family response regulator